jgi:hypothetical protein
MQDRSTENRLDQLVEPVVYGDIFDFPVTLDEMHRFCTLKLSREELESEIKECEEFSRIVGSRDGYYFLKGREALVAIREQRKESTEIAWRHAQAVVKLIKYVPFVKGILVTGSLAVDNARRKDDLDFLVIIDSGRLWFAFLILGMLQRVFSRRFLCPNYYMTVDHLELTRHSFYVAREAAQARTIYGREPCLRFREANRWIHEVLPNTNGAARPAPLVVERKGVLRWMTGTVEKLFRGGIGNRVESLLGRMLKRRLEVHYGTHGQEVPPKVLENALNEKELRFHGLDHENMIYKEMDKRKDRLKEILNNGS